MQSDISRPRPATATILQFRPHTVQHRSSKIMVYALRGQEAIEHMMEQPPKDSDPKFSTLFREVRMFRNLHGRAAQGFKHDRYSRTVLSEEELKLLVSVGMNPDPTF